MTAALLVACGSGGAANSGAGGSTNAATGSGGGGLLIPTGGFSDDEQCGNGLDDDGNGRADDGCPCDIGASQPCFVGSPDAAGKGACTFGTQTCEDASTGEITEGAWSSCEDAGALSDEECGNGVDDDCDGDVDENCDGKQPPFENGSQTTGADKGSSSAQTTGVGGAPAGPGSSVSGVGGKEPPIENGASSGGLGGAPSTTVSTSSTSSTASSTVNTTASTSSGPTCQQGVKVTLVVDRSNSMGKRPNGTVINDPANFAQSKWAIAVDAIHAMLNKGGNLGIDFGLEFFPRYVAPSPAKKLGCQKLKDRIKNGGWSTNDEKVCTATATPVLPSATSTAKVKAEITKLDTFLCDETPMETALERVLSIPTDYVVFVTDGAPTCGQSPAMAIKKLAAQGKRTFVVGYDGAGLTATAKGHLNRSACAGLEPKNPGQCNGSTYVGTGDAFYNAKSPSGSDLSAILNEILGQICP